MGGLNQSRRGAIFASVTDTAADLIAQHYDELRSIARGLLRRERIGHTLDTGGLVNEAWLRLAARSGLSQPERTRFFAIAVTTMRRILVDHARARLTQKRGAGASAVQLDDEAMLLSTEEADHLLVLDEALERLQLKSPRSAEVVRYRFFGGLSLEETATLLGISSKTVHRDWLSARAWLRKEVAQALDLPD
jgi:RNA polymerase sigma factor (TIGR02999 family)